MKSDQEIGMPDVESQLSELLRKKNKQTKNYWRKIAASIAIIFAVSCIAIAAIINHEIMASDENKPEATENEFMPEAKNTLSVPADTALAMPRIVAFDNAELCEIVDSIAGIYKLEVVFINEEVKHLHLHFKFRTDDKLNDVIQNLNMFEKINIKDKEGILEVE